jgi:colanic acid/amylovoran biosynthesis glycosyltransferase
VQACRLVEKKGLDVALKAFAHFAANRPGARFTIAGEGPLREKVASLVDELGLGGRVDFAGFLSEEDLCALYHSAHVFVHPSQVTEDQNQEGIPNSMLEAMSTGLPVIATQHGGIPEAVADGRAGLLSAERDVDGLLDHMERLVTEPGLWAEMGRQASADMHENFEQSAQVRKLEDVYRELLEDHGGN